MWGSLPCPQPLCLWGRKCMDPWCWCGARLPVAPHHLQRPLCIPPPSRLLPQTATSLGSDQLQIGPHACLWIVGAWASTLKGSPSLFPICPAAPRSFLSFSHIHIQLSSGFLSSLLHFSSWSWFMTFPRQTLWPLAPSPPPLSRSSSLRRAHTNTTQSHFFLLCSFSSLCLQCLLFLTFPCRRCRCVLHHLVCLEAMKEQSHTHAHRPCVSSLWGGWGRGLVEERGGGGSKEASLSNHRTVITVAAAGSKPDFRCALKHWRGLLYTRHWLTTASTTSTHRKERGREGGRRRREED